MYQVPKKTTAASPPHWMAGALGDCLPDRPALRTMGAGADGGGVSVAFPMRRATTMSRWAALKRGVHVVSVRRLSVVESRTATSWGSTFMEWSTLYWNFPSRV